jgi:Family of unknown function (DUF6364)
MEQRFPKPQVSCSNQPGRAIPPAALRDACDFRRRGRRHPVRFRRCGWDLDTYPRLKYYTYMYKLTLSVDEGIASRAKRYAEQKGTSVSELVERFLDVLGRPIRSEDFPELRRLRGCLRGSAPDAYHKHLLRKHR